MINKNEFNNILYADGSGFIESCRGWLTKKLSYSYTIKERNKKWIGEFNNGNSQWQCNSLLNACEKYYWNDNSKKDTDNKINELRNNIKDAYDTNNEEKFVNACIDVMEWGGVARQNGLSLLKLYLKNDLIETITKTCETMISDSPNLSGFQSKKYIMTSGFSKIYSLLERKKIFIYDSRVATGLGILLRKHYKEFNKIPKELRFPSPESQVAGRVVQFYDICEIKNKKYNCKQPSFSSNYTKYAEWNIKFNWFLEYLTSGQKLILTINNKDNELNEKEEKMLAVEQALFMIGYRVNPDNFID